MCDLCKKVKRLSLGDAMNEIGERLNASSADKDHLNDLLDSLMEEPDENDDLALAWETERRA